MPGVPPEVADQVEGEFHEPVATEWNSAVSPNTSLDKKTNRINELTDLAFM